MSISSVSTQMTMQHSLQSQTQRIARLQIQAPAATPSDDTRASQNSSGPAANRSPSKLFSEPLTLDRLSELAENGDELDADTRLKVNILESFLKEFFGIELKLGGENFDFEQPAGTDIPDVNANTPQASIRFDHIERYEESESLSLAMQADIRHADGSRQRVAVQFQMQRYYASETRFSLQIGEPSDPLVVNFDGQGVRLSESRMDFDLDADGETESLARLAEGNAMLVRDDNGNGRVDDGSEVLGAQSGDAFAELAAADDNGDGLIDARDRIYERLRLWSQADDEGLQSLSEAGIKALLLDRIGSPFRLTHSNNQTLGAVRESGLYLDDQNGAGLLQRIDLMA